jgi:GT2 family glycosyltransferase
VTEPVTVAIPVRDGGTLLAETLAAVRAQRLERPIELLVADSASQDGSAGLARRHGARVIEVDPSEFSHGGTRGLLARSASGSHVAFLTQDAVPADEHWLEHLLHGFETGDRVGLVYGPYEPRADASPMVRRELIDWFRSLSPDGSPRVDRGLPDTADPRALFFTDANSCVERGALDRVPFREVAYAEDQQLAREMLAAGYAKVFVPDAAVVHSHDYGALELFRRLFDESRALREVHGIVAPANPIDIALGVQRAVRDDLDYMRRQGSSRGAPLRLLPASLAHHLARALGAAVGSRAGLLPPRLRRACSLERRADFSPLAGRGTR